MLTTQQLERINKTYQPYAGEAIEVEQICGSIYIYGSELACLRMYHKASNKSARAGYSENLKTWYFTFDLLFGSGN
jgi:hypothetical protein